MPRTNVAGVKFPKSIRVSWGRKLKQARGNTSQAKYAAHIGIPQATLSKIEHGDLSITDDLKWLICARIGRLVDDIFPMPPVPPGLVAIEVPDEDVA